MTRILLVDDHAVVRRGIRAMIEGQMPDTRFGEAGAGAEALALLGNQPWDIVILDLSMPGRNGLEILKDIKAQRPGLPVIILSMYAEEQYGIRALSAGASGYMTKDMTPDELAGAVRRVLSGRKYVSPGLAERLADSVAGGHAGAPHESLSDRELEIMCLIAEGKTVSEIAAETSLSVNTVSTYRTRALAKMGMDNNAQFMQYALTNGLVSG